MPVEELRRQRIIEENKYYDLLKQNPRYRLQGCNTRGKRIIGIIRGNPEEYREHRDFLDYEYYSTWKDAYYELELK